MWGMNLELLGLMAQLHQKHPLGKREELHHGWIQWASCAILNPTIHLEKWPGTDFKSKYCNWCTRVIRWSSWCGGHKQWSDVIYFISEKPEEFFTGLSRNISNRWVRRADDRVNSAKQNVGSVWMFTDQITQVPSSGFCRCFFSCCLKGS